jgi:hypothetical protein
MEIEATHLIESEEKIIKGQELSLLNIFYIYLFSILKNDTNATFFNILLQFI